jgi:prepilin-type N-terminal cleavage/methylation domain-containing protein
MRMCGHKKSDARQAGSLRYSRLAACATGNSRAFTLIEIMVVVAIMGIILAAGIPSLYAFFHKTGFRKSMSDILETCQSARSKAIMTGKYADLVIHPREGRLEVAGDSPKSGYGTWAHSAKIEGARLAALRINNSNDDLSQVEEVRVRFYPDGKCEEMTMLLEPDEGGKRGITLEITTGLPMQLNAADIQALLH